MLWYWDYLPIWCVLSEVSINADLRNLTAQGSHTMLLFLVGLALGGAWGLREGGTRKLAVPSARLRLNSILNSVTRRGSFMGNSAGVLGTSP